MNRKGSPSDKEFLSSVSEEIAADKAGIFPNQPEVGIPDPQQTISEIENVKEIREQVRRCMAATTNVFGTSNCGGDIKTHRILFPVPVAERKVAGMGGKFREQAAELQNIHRPGLVYDMCSICGAVYNLKEE